ncbi:MAG: hypothetical protein Q7W55_13550 [Pseudohongiella sp.]|nr:hypothetical protein [Pseudohongiella sp.]
MEAQISEGIIVGAVGGAFAGLAVCAVQYLHSKVVFFADSKRVYKWLSSNTTMEPGKNFRSTTSIASWNNLTEDRVRYICSAHEKIYLSTGDKEDLWGVLNDGTPRVDNFL